LYYNDTVHIEGLLAINRILPRKQEMGMGEEDNE